MNNQICPVYSYPAPLLWLPFLFDMTKNDIDCLVKITSAVWQQPFIMKQSQTYRMHQTPPLLHHGSCRTNFIIELTNYWVSYLVCFNIWISHSVWALSKVINKHWILLPTFSHDSRSPLSLWGLLGARVYRGFLCMCLNFPRWYMLEFSSNISPIFL